MTTTEDVIGNVPLEERPIRLAICIPSGDAVEAPFAVHLAELYGAVCATLVADGIGDVHIFRVADTLLDRGRTRLVQEALQWGATHLLWLDTDMTFPRTAAHALLARNVDIVGANYTTRRFPHIPVAFKVLGNRELEVPSERCWTTADATGIEEVMALGFGCLLMNARIFEQIKPPVFHAHFDAEKKVWVGEDVTFAEKARAAGYTVYVDHDLSKEVGHLGRFTFTPSHAETLRHHLDLVAPTETERAAIAGHLQ